jgi:hypothetical protein
VKRRLVLDLTNELKTSNCSVRCKIDLDTATKTMRNREQLLAHKTGKLALTFQLQYSLASDRIAQF